MNVTTRTGCESVAQRILQRVGGRTGRREVDWKIPAALRALDRQQLVGCLLDEARRIVEAAGAPSGRSVSTSTRVCRLRSPPTCDLIASPW
jgi:hypothetical protein